jgi:hypothetical protein
VLTTTPLTNWAFYIVTITNVQGGCEFPPEYFLFPFRAPVEFLGAPPFDTRLRTRRVGTDWELSWPAGAVLQETTNITPAAPDYFQANWHDVTNASSPMVLSNAPTRFFRVKYFTY